MKSVFYVIIRTLLVIPAKLLFRVRVVGRKNEPKKGEGVYLVCGNHQTVLDPVFLCIALRRQQPHFMAKAELFRVPVLGRLVRWLGAYPVSRGKGDVGAIKHAIHLLENGRSIGLFPQGTRCAGKDPRDTKAKNGAAMIASHAGAQILPVHIKMKNYQWKFFRRVTVVIGEPIPFEHFHYDKEAAGEYARISNEIFAEICRLGDTVK
ncbi:MAG: 1-acyl-sn-glycerol-3-phosphate acyltransferase [Clostridia bacterium]|nr:1-acyl-sn-glycerol-3-phosphate acyltransferase [Clostridia bacterium]